MLAAICRTRRLNEHFAEACEQKRQAIEQNQRRRPDQRVEHAADRRYTLARLSSQGNMMVQRLRQGRENHLQHWLVQLDEPDLAALRQGLEALNRVLPSTYSQEAGICGSQDEHSPG